MLKKALSQELLSRAANVAQRRASKYHFAGKYALGDKMEERALKFSHAAVTKANKDYALAPAAVKNLPNEFERETRLIDFKYNQSIKKIRNYAVGGLGLVGLSEAAPKVVYKLHKRKQ